MGKFKSVISILSCNIGIIKEMCKIMQISGVQRAQRLLMEFLLVAPVNQKIRPIGTDAVVVDNSMLCFIVI